MAAILLIKIISNLFPGTPYGCIYLKCPEPKIGNRKAFANKVNVNGKVTVVLRFKHRKSLTRSDHHENGEKFSLCKKMRISLNHTG